jgi:hypothetical protein
MNFSSNKLLPWISLSFRAFSQLFAWILSQQRSKPCTQALRNPIHHVREHKKLKRFSSKRECDPTALIREFVIMRLLGRKWRRKLASKSKGKD